VMVHEGGLRLVPISPATPLGSRFGVFDAQGVPVQARWPADHEHLTLSRPRPPEPSGDPERIAAATGGYGFHLADCVDALLHNLLDLAA
ncbi:hypothetical protein, partial [Brachybacterium sp. YJGR34]|uniref:hypothetical protein n=1 Tax=Brachybacterium sp. YJGR34 TaxID=2059911 RepID=UPI0013002396